MAKFENAYGLGQLSETSLEYTIRHVFLPPRLPQEDDSESGGQVALLCATVEALAQFRDILPIRERQSAETAMQLIETMRHMHLSSGDVRENVLRQELARLNHHRVPIVLHIRAQNAGVIVSRREDGFHFEAFELSPLNESVMTVKGRLRRHFPGQAVRMEPASFEVRGFQNAIAETLAKMSHQNVPGTRPKVKKAGQKHEEDRDTCHPKVVTELFMGFLGSIGEVIPIKALSKHTREEVLWQNARSPWRRSPLWLLIRVALQLLFTRLEPESNLYKAFMVLMMSHILQVTRNSAIDSDTLYSMHAKLVQRRLKIGTAIPISVKEAVDRVIITTEQELTRRWQKIQAEDTINLGISRLCTLNVERDTWTSLPELDAQIDDISQWDVVRSKIPFAPVPGLVQHSKSTLPSLSGIDAGDSMYKLANLVQFEQWVSDSLEEWADSQFSDDACDQLRALIIQYHILTQNQYSNNPEGLSIAILTILQLWIACDTIAMKTCSLIKDYDPEIAVDLLQNLLLPFRTELRSLYLIETYLKERREQALHPLLLKASDPNSFAARFVDRSSKHQGLLTDIENWAGKKREAKKTELVRLKHEYATLIKRWEEAECEEHKVVKRYHNAFGELQEWSEWEHKPGCKRCQYKTSAERLNIEVDEWPLPRNKVEAKTIVFELQLPRGFASWREATIFLLTDVLKMTHEPAVKPRKSYSLSSDSQLRDRFKEATAGSHIGLLSQTKPHVGTHRVTKLVATTTEDDVCLASGLKYQYFDDHYTCFVDTLLANHDVPHVCTYKLPEHAAALQRFIFRPASNSSGPDSNELIASQADCPTNMSLDEFQELGTLPNGTRLQWLNLLGQLAAPSIDFKRPEATLVIWQCIYQAGPKILKSILRDSHTDAGSDDFASTILKVLLEALERTKANWESAMGLGVITNIASRVLSLNATPSVQKLLLDFLNTAREVFFEWVCLLCKRIEGAQNEEERTELTSKCVEIALFASTCFDVETRYLGQILKDPQHASMLIKITMVIWDGRQTLAPAPGSCLHILYWRFRRLIYRSYSYLITDYRGLDEAICQTWSAYRATASWKIVSKELGYWLVTNTQPTDHSVEVTVHYNLLTGELLVDGNPLDRLPKNFEDNPMYATLFGRSAVEVLPSTAPGMRFSTKLAYKGQIVHFGLNDQGSLRVQASQNGTVYYMLPSHLFNKSFPIHFVEDRVHWYNAREETVEFRPKNDPWNTSASSWIMRKHRTSLMWQLHGSKAALVTLSTASSDLLGSILSSLAVPARIHISLPDDSSDVVVDIPTLQIAFSLDSSKSTLESKQYPGYYIDEDQTAGCLVGLCNRLVLQHCKNEKRMVLVPEGNATYGRSSISKHVYVRIDTNNINYVHSFSIDEDIGQLRDNGGLHSALFRAYLHALTAFCLPDELTQKTGTEEALSILNSMAIRSHEQLKHEDVLLLERIAGITPVREYYPANERVMQTVDWSDSVGYMMQHPGFYQAVKSIFDEIKVSKLFYPDSELCIPLLKMDRFLLERDCIRSSTFRVAGFGAEAFTSTRDVDYDARDQGYHSQQRSNVVKMCSMIQCQRDEIFWKPASQDELWSAVSGISFMDGAMAKPKQVFSTLNYNGDLLFPDVPIASQWLVLHRCLNELRSKPAEKHRVMLWLATLAFSEHMDSGMVQMLALLYYAPSIKGQISLPSGESFSPSDGYDAFRFDIERCCGAAIVRYNRRSPEARLTRFNGESEFQFDRRCQSAFDSKRDRARNSFVSAVVQQWPCDRPKVPALDIEDLSFYLDVHRAMPQIEDKFKVWFDNLRVYRYFQELESVTRGLVQVHLALVPGTMEYCSKKAISHRFVSSEDLFSLPAPCLDMNDELSEMCVEDNPTTPSSRRLRDFVEKLRGQSMSKFEQSYVNGLEKSLEHLQQRGTASKDAVKLDNKAVLDYRMQCKSQVESIYQRMSESVKSQAPSSCSPRVSHAYFLERLSFRHWRGLRDDWRACIVAYGRAVAALQRANRIVYALSVEDIDAAVNEMRNVGHRNWDPFEHPDSLLLEIESGITIREVQEEIAAQMRRPPSNRNSVMQLNMGEGKSSVIIPIVAVKLADGSRLVRVVVPKPQSKQMAHMLRSKLSGLLHRRIYFMPFSRDLQLDASAVDAIFRLCRECMERGAVVLMQPEHILSFELMGLDHRLSGHSEIGRALWNVQTFLDKYTRDIVDESDESFSVKFELIYTIGAQRPIEMSPDRWLVIQQVLHLVRTFAPDVDRSWPEGLSLTHYEDGVFPRMRIIKPQAGEDLFNRVAEHICKTGVDGLPIAHQPPQTRKEVYQYITCSDLPREAAERIEISGSNGFWTDTTRSTLLLLRGLIASGVLAFVFGQKRWRVHYGLDPSRIPATRLAVPFRGKDTPAPRSEFSHPDVLIVLTSICYYYKGLNDDDLFTAFSQLLRSDQREVEYQTWIKDAPLIPSEFTQLQGINLRDRDHCVSRLFPFLRYAKSVVDYFLSTIVFPKEMRGFPHKLTTSGWDLGKIKQFPTTGFSGTNDARALLPLDVEYVDLPAQTYTNALVLHYLLQSENSVILLDPPKAVSNETDAMRLLHKVTSLTIPVHVILDAGAQILELDNHGVAKEWLGMQRDDQIQGVVYFDRHNELSVVDRHGFTESLQTSSFATRLHVCLVYLDQAHTRGTDLKLPTYYRAAVTLGAQLTKDGLVQACMRMRKLGKGQTVVFCVPSEIETKIRSYTGKGSDASIETTDILAWAVEETYTDIRRSFPIWAAQGERYGRHQLIRKQSPASEFPSLTQAHRLLEDEMQSLKQRYGVCVETKPLEQEPEAVNEYSARINGRSLEFGDMNIRSAALSEEQERELAPEIEEERQIQRAPPAKAAKHFLHPDLSKFVSNGSLIAKSGAYAPAFDGLHDTSAASAAKMFDNSTLSCRNLLATIDFSRTVHKDPTSFQSDAFQRPVRWILTSRANVGHEITQMVIISPYEAQELIESVKRSKKVALHLYKPRLNLKYRQLDLLDFIVVPKPSTPPKVARPLAIKLNVFGGQLYLGSLEEYRRTCQFLGLAADPAPTGWIVAADGFVISDDQGNVGRNSGLKSSPVQFVKILTMKIRRHGQDIAKTHVGCMLDGKLLTQSDFLSE